MNTNTNTPPESEPSTIAQATGAAHVAQAPSATRGDLVARLRTGIKAGRMKNCW